MITVDSVRSRLRSAGRAIVLKSARPALLMRIYRIMLDHASHLMLASKFLSIADSESGRSLVLQHAGHARRAARRFPGLHQTAEAHLVEWARLCYEDDRHAAAAAARAWMLAPEPGGMVAVVTPPGSPPRLQVTLPATGAIVPSQRLEIARDAARALWTYEEAIDDGAPYKAAAESIVLAVAQTLSLAGRHGEAEGFLAGLLAIRHSWFIEMAQYGVRLMLTGGEIPAHIRQLLGEDVDHFRDKFCHRPFEEFEITPRGNVHVCCVSYLPEPIGNAKAEGASAIVNSKRAIKVRKSILDGKFTYCDWAKCPDIKNGWLPDRDAVTDPAMREAIRTNSGRIAGPRHLVMVYDATCNLWCPMCRKSRITAKGAEFDEIMRMTRKVVLPMFPHLRTVQMNNYGDIFASRSCRHVLDAVSPERYPGLKLIFITNGVLLTEQEWAKFPNIHRMVQSIRVSVDATTKPIYDKIRLGGDFPKLCRNLEFLSRLRREGTIEEFRLSFVVQRENYPQMSDFVDWAESLGCDAVVFEVLQDWGMLSRPTFEANAVHLPTNPDFAKFVQAAGEIAVRAKLALEGGKPTQITHDFDLLR